MDLCGHITIRSLGGSKHVFIIVNNYSRYTEALFIIDKGKTFMELVRLIKQVHVLKVLIITPIRNDHRSEFDKKE